MAGPWWTSTGGFADEARTRPWGADTIVGVYSTTKTMTALTALLVADRGELDFAAPVARYWPEFATPGKDSVTVAQLMSHSAGLCGCREPITGDDLYDWPKVTALLAAQEPFWQPGTASGYHAMTQGYLVGEVVRRITGRSLGTVFREEIAEPRVADFHIGPPSSEDARVAELIPPPGPAPMGGPDDSELQGNVAGNPHLEVQVTRTRAWRVDLILGVPIRFGLGFALDTGRMPNRNTLYRGGYGGSLTIIDLDASTA